MTPNLVLQALRQAARAAFDLGVQHGRKGGEREKQAAAAVLYAEALVLPQVEIAIEEAVEQAFVQQVTRRGAP